MTPEKSLEILAWSHLAGWIVAGVCVVVGGVILLWMWRKGKFE